MNLSASEFDITPKNDLISAAVILAAGRSSRFKGHKLKRLMPSGLCLLEVILLSAEKWNIQDLVVVLGPDTAELSEKVHKRDFRTIVNFRPELGMGHSLKTGVKTLLSHNAAIDNILFTPADIPMITPDTVNILIKRAEQKKNQGDPSDHIIIPAFNGRKGHPPLMGSDHFDSILSLPDSKGPNSIARENPGCIEILAVDDPGILRDIDTPDDYEALSQLLETFLNTLN